MLKLKNVVFTEVRSSPGETNQKYFSAKYFIIELYNANGLKSRLKYKVCIHYFAQHLNLLFIQSHNFKVLLKIIFKPVL